MGTSAIGRGTAVEEQKVKASSADGSPGFLDAKVDGDTIQVIADQLVVTDLQSFVGTGTYDAATTGTIVIIGVGFRPTSIDLRGSHNANVSWAVGSSDGTTDRNLAGQDAVQHHGSATGLTRIYTSSGQVTTLSLTSFDSDGFTVTKTISAGSPTGTIAFNYTVYK